MVEDNGKKQIVTIRLDRHQPSAGPGGRGPKIIDSLKANFNKRFRGYNINVQTNGSRELYISGTLDDDQLESFDKQLNNFMDNSRIRFTSRWIREYDQIEDVETPQADTLPQSDTLYVSELEKKVVDLGKQVETLTAERDELAGKYEKLDKDAGHFLQRNDELEGELGRLNGAHETQKYDNLTRLNEFADRLKVAEEQLGSDFYNLQAVSLDAVAESIRALGIDEPIASKEDAQKLIKKFSDDEGSTLLENYFAGQHGDRSREYLDALTGIESKDLDIQRLQATGLDADVLKPSIDKLEDDKKSLIKTIESYEGDASIYVTSTQNQLSEIGKELEEDNKLDETRTKVQEIFGGSDIPVHISTNENEQDYTVTVYLPVKKRQESSLPDLLLNRDTLVQKVGDLFEDGQVSLESNGESELLSYVLTLSKSEYSSNDANSVVGTLEQQIAENYLRTSLPYLGVRIDLIANKIIGAGYESVRTEAVSAVEAPSVEETVHVVGEPIVVSQQPRLSAKKQDRERRHEIELQIFGEAGEYGATNRQLLAGIRERLGYDVHRSTVDNDLKSLMDQNKISLLSEKSVHNEKQFIIYQEEVDETGINAVVGEGSSGAAPARTLDVKERRRLFIQYVLESENPTRAEAYQWIEQQTGVKVSVSIRKDDTKHFRQKGILTHKTDSNNSPYEINNSALARYRLEHISQGLEGILADDGQDVRELSETLLQHVDVPFSTRNVTQALIHLPSARKEEGSKYFRNGAAEKLVAQSNTITPTEDVGGTGQIRALDTHEMRRLFMQYLIDNEKPTRIGAFEFIKQETGYDVPQGTRSKLPAYFINHDLISGEAEGKEQHYRLHKNALDNFRTTQLREGLDKVLSDTWQSAKELYDALSGYMDVPYNTYSIGQTINKLPYAKTRGRRHSRVTEEQPVAGTQSSNIQPLRNPVEEQLDNTLREYSSISRDLKLHHQAQDLLRDLPDNISVNKRSGEIYFQGNLGFADDTYKPPKSKYATRGITPEETLQIYNFLNEQLRESISNRGSNQDRVALIPNTTILDLVYMVRDVTPKALIKYHGEDSTIGQHYSQSIHTFHGGTVSPR